MNSLQRSGRPDLFGSSSSVSTVELPRTRGASLKSSPGPSPGDSSAAIRFSTARHADVLPKPQSSVSSNWADARGEASVCQAVYSCDNHATLGSENAEPPGVQPDFLSCYTECIKRLFMRSYSYFLTVVRSTLRYVSRSRRIDALTGTLSGHPERKAPRAWSRRKRSGQALEAGPYERSKSRRRDNPTVVVR